MMLTGLALPEAGVLATGLSTHGTEGGEKMISSSSAAGGATHDDRPETTLGGSMGIDEEEEDPYDCEARSGTAIGADPDMTVGRGVPGGVLWVETVNPRLRGGRPRFGARASVVGGGVGTGGTCGASLSIAVLPSTLDVGPSCS